MKNIFCLLALLFVTVGANAQLKPTKGELIPITDLRIDKGGGCGQPNPNGQTCPIVAGVTFRPEVGGSCYTFSAEMTPTPDGQVLSIFSLAHENCTRPVMLEPLVHLQLEASKVQGNITVANPVHIRYRFAP